MSTEALRVNGRDQVVSTLIGGYVQATLFYLLIVALCWVIGLEAIHGHPLPFYALVDPAFGPDAGSLVENLVNAGALLGAAVVLGLAIVALNRFVLRESQAGLSLVLTGRTLASLVAFAIVFPASVATIRGGPDALAHAYSRQAYEYISDIGVGGSIHGLFQDYEEVHQYLSMHAKVHPPGPIAILWVMSFVAGRTPMGLSLATIVFGALSVVPMYYWARDLLGARRGLIAALLYTLVPTIVLFTATSADIAFMPFTLTTLFLFWRAIHLPNDDSNRSAAVPTADGVVGSYGPPGRRRYVIGAAYAAGAGAFYGLLGLISFSLLSIGVFFALVGLWRLGDLRYRWAVLRTAVVMAAAAASVHYLVYAWSGYNSIDVFHLAKHQFDTDQANLDALDPRFAAIWWKFLNPLCWFFFAGVPVSVLFLGCFASASLRKSPLVWVVGLSLVAFDILYLARGEGERSAMYIMPFLVLPAACRLDELVAACGNWRPLTATLAFLGLQSIAIECVLYTYW